MSRAADVIEKHPVEMLNYAVGFLDNAQIDKIALQTLATKVEDALKELDSTVFKAWVSDCLLDQLSATHARVGATSRGLDALSSANYDIFHAVLCP